ncbi:hypothetical protein GCM10017771_41550 [Streptomyces capitiformicae]|uniref:Uncharacterized protein n=1 Tax=Streptomyces capitiformicae TaxID=2014920 RepID=A0A919LCU5_9ACTN|nr:hypothetical protein GCM10017771_41550 [Streptomyces capitiformicae]
MSAPPAGSAHVVWCVRSQGPDDAIPLDLVTKAPRPLPTDGDLALSNSFGFGGHNAVLALRRTVQVR